MPFRSHSQILFPLVLIMAGGLSNLFDRLMRGYVIDIVTIAGLSLNIADIAICIGGSMAVYYSQKIYQK